MRGPSVLRRAQYERVGGTGLTTQEYGRILDTDAQADALPTLYVVADRDYVGDDERWLALLGEVAEAATGRPVWLQVRAKQASRAEHGALARRARKAVPVGVPLLLNGEDAMAGALGYDGVHWPEDRIPPAPPAVSLRWRTAAVHSPGAVAAAVNAGATAVVFGSVYEPGSKTGSAAGIAALERVVAASPLPVYAIGGITVDRVCECIEAGAAGVAVVSGVLGAPQPSRAVERYLEALDEAFQRARA